MKSHWCKGYQKPGLQNWPFVSFSSWPQHLPHKDNSCYVQVKTNQLFLVPRQKEDLQCNHILILNQINLCICQPNYQSGCSPNAKRNANLCFWESGTNFLINQIFWQKITKVLIRCSSHVFTNSEFSYYYKYLNIEISIFKIFTNSKFWEKKIGIFRFVKTCDELIKVHIFWEGHKILRNLYLTFGLCIACEK